MKREEIEENVVIEWYDGMLDCEGIVTVVGYDFYPSRILEELDPIAYSCGLSDYYDSISDEYYCEGME